MHVKRSRPDYIDELIYQAASNIAIERRIEFREVLAQLQNEYDKRGIIRLDQLIRKLRQQDSQ